MKKIVGTIVAAALIAASAFAETNVGMGFSRAIFTPFAYDGKDCKMDISTSWGDKPRIGGSISGASEDCGVVGTFLFDGGSLGVNDEAYVWVKPFSCLKLKIGQAYDDTLRGNACFGSWDWLRVGATMFGEDFVFDRVTGNRGLEAGVFKSGDNWKRNEGVIVEVDPIEGLHFAVGLNGLYPAGGATWENVFQNVQVQGGYTITDIMQIKAQWIGLGKDADDKLQGIIEAAVGLKMVENMTLDIGVKMNTAKDSPFQVAAYWSMPFSALRVNVGAGMTFAPNYVLDNMGMLLQVGAGVSYDFGNGLAVEADVRFAKAFCSASGFTSDPAISFGAWLNKGIASGTLGIGVQGTMRDTIRDFTPAHGDDFMIAVPVRVQCFF